MFSKNDLIITRSNTGYFTVRWKHNNRAIKTHLTEQKQATNFIKWLVNYLNKEKISSA